MHKQYGKDLTLIHNQSFAACVIPAKSWILFNSQNAILHGGCRKCGISSEDAKIAKMVTQTCTWRMQVSSEDPKTAVVVGRMHKLQKWYYSLVDPSEPLQLRLTHYEHMMQDYIHLHPEAAENMARY